MPKYTLFISQMGVDPMDGGGRLVSLAARTIEEAQAEAERFYRDDEEIVVDDMRILEIVSMNPIDIKALSAARNAEREAKQRANAEAREREQMEALKRKYGG